MNNPADLQIGYLTTGTADQPHHPSFEKLLPPAIKVVFGGLNLFGRTRSDLAGKSAEVVRQAVEFSRKFSLRGLIVSGAPLVVFNPALESSVSQTVKIPVATPLSSSTAALNTFAAKNLLLMTPFHEEINTRLREHLSAEGFNVLACPPFEASGLEARGKMTSNQLSTWVEHNLTLTRNIDAIYFQGSSMDPVPVIHRLEEKFHVPVIASNCAMLWSLLSRLGHKYCIKGYGRLLAQWPSYEN